MAENSMLYKYLDVDGGIAMLQRSNLQFTNSTRLNDPFDCHPALYDFSNAPVNENDLSLAGFLKEKGELDTENLRNRTWICSLSKVHNSLLMWSYYGNHKGVCVGIDMDKAMKYISRVHCKILGPLPPLEVHYTDIIEKPDYFHRFDGYFEYQLTTKAKEWEHEQEVRLILIDPSATVMALPYEPKKQREVIDWREVRAYPRIGRECFDSLYLGIKIDSQKKDEIIREARKCNPAIKIYQMTVDPDAFKLKAKLVIKD